MNLNSILQTALMIKLIVICLAAQNQVGSLQDLTSLFTIGQPLEQEAEKSRLHLVSSRINTSDSSICFLTMHTQQDTINRLRKKAFFEPINSVKVRHAFAQ